MRTFAMSAPAWRPPRRLAVALLLLANVGAAAAMDLQEAFKAALGHDSVLAASQAGIRAAQEQVNVAQAQLRPNVSFNASRTRNELTRTQSVNARPVTTEESYYSQGRSLVVRQPLYRKALALGVEQAHAGERQARFATQYEERNLATRLITAYFEVLLGQDQLHWVEAQMQLTRTQLQSAQRAFAAGSGVRTDIDEAQARLDLALADEVVAREQLAYARHQLAVLTGVDSAALVPLDPPRLAQLPLVEGPVADWMARAREQSPELAALRERRAAVALEVERLGAGHYPTLDASLQWVDSASENVTTPSSSYRNTSIGLQLSIPLYQGGGTSAAVRQAMAELDRVDAQIETSERDLGSRVHQQVRLVLEGQQRMRALEQALRSAQQLEYSTQRSYEAGARTWIDVLNATQNAQRIRFDLAKARYDWLLARTRLSAFVGAEAAAIVDEANQTLLKAPTAVQ